MTASTLTLSKYLSSKGRTKACNGYATRCTVYSCSMMATGCYLGKHAVGGVLTEAYAARAAADLAGISRALALPFIVPPADGPAAGQAPGEYSCGAALNLVAPSLGAASSE